MRDNVDILVILETKIDSSFPLNQFLIDGYSTPYQPDRNSHGGGIFIYIRYDILNKELKTSILPIDVIFIELNIQNSKWILMGGYNP